LIDGGKGQLSSALEAMESKNVSIPAIGLAKRHETIIRKDNERFTEVDLPRNSHIIKLLQRIRDESHRFAVSYHSTLKTKRQTASILEEIPSIGPATRKKLLKTFGSVKGIMQARQWEIAKVIGANKSKILRQYLRPIKKDQKNV